MLKKAAEWKVNDKVLPKSAERYARKAKDGTDTGVNLINKQLLNVIKHVGLEPSVAVVGRKKKVTVYGVHSDTVSHHIELKMVLPELSVLLFLELIQALLIFTMYILARKHKIKI